MIDLSHDLGTTHNQFGFKAKLGTNLCIYALKEATHMYVRQNSFVLIGFINACYRVECLLFSFPVSLRLPACRWSLVVWT